MILPDKPGAVIRWKYRYDGVYQYQVAVLIYDQSDYDKGLMWHRPGWGAPWSQVRMQMTADTGWGVWEILHPGEDYYVQKSGMNPQQKLVAMRDGQPVRDAYGKPMTQNGKGEWINEFGDTPCPTCGEMTNKRCWQCEWVRAYGDYRNNPALENPEDDDGGM